MSIAVLLYGHVRTFQQCWKSFIKNVVDVNSCDVFMHTWDEIDHNTKSWYGQIESTAAFDEETAEMLQKYYTPKGFLIEHQEAWGGCEFTFLEKPVVSVSTVTSHYLFYSMGQANQLRREYKKKTGIHYDFVIVTRPDIQFLTPLDIGKVIWQAEISGVDLENSRFVAYTYTTNKHPQKLLINRVNDLIFFGRPQVIDRYIKANESLSPEFIEEHALNYPSIYTAAELAAGIMPLHIAYNYKDDWVNVQSQERNDAVNRNNVAVNSAKEAESTRVSSAGTALTLIKTFKPLAKIIFYPLKIFYKWSEIHFPWLTQN